MRLLTMLGLIVLAVSLRPERAVGQEALAAGPAVHGTEMEARIDPARAAGQEALAAGPAVQTVAVMEPRIDPRLLVGARDRRAALERADQGRADPDGGQWNLTEMVNYMGWGMLPGFLIGTAVGATTGGGGLEGMANVMFGGMVGMSAGMAAGGIVYTVRTL